MSKYGRVAVLLAAPVLMAQYPPGQYPPGGQYPRGGQYPPGQYPPGQYPQGGGGGVSIPSVHIPKRKPKDAKEVENGLQSVEGTVRKIDEKKLALDTPLKGPMQFRLLAKTAILNTNGKPLGERVLEPGDVVKVWFSADDEETALKVTLTRAGTPEEKAAAEKLPDEPTVEDKTTRVSAPEKDDDKFVLRRGKQAHKPSEPDPPPPAPELKAEVKTEAKIDPRESKEDPPTVTASNPKIDPVIAAAREAAGDFSETLPNFIVQQHTMRYRSEVKPFQWQAIDLVTAEVTVTNGVEEYKKVAINGKPTARAIEKSGSWSTGEFATTQQDILSTATDAKFVKRSQQRVGGRDAVAYDFTVAQPNSHWRIIPQDSKPYRPPYKGIIWIDLQTKRVLKIEQRATYFPDDFEFNRVEQVLEYGIVRIGGRPILLPVRSENIVCQSATSYCARNEINFRNYRQFGSKSDIVFENE